MLLGHEEVQDVKEEGVTLLAPIHKVQLLEDVHVDLHVVHVDAVDVIELHVVAGAVSPGHSRDLRGLDSLVPEQVGPPVSILLFPLPNPPVVALTLNGSLALDGDGLAVAESHEVEEGGVLHGPLEVVGRGLDRAIDLEGHIGQVLDEEAEGGNGGVFRHQDGPVSTPVLVGQLKALFKGLGVLLLLLDGGSVKVSSGDAPTVLNEVEGGLDRGAFEAEEGEEGCP
mmetsp:Transcript_15723/g.26507  ORF Transcript_15723/g.26507 Transcript_15723/m.26507 type:complete len:226 (+) Transcript_15723:965-1642(+)